MHIKIEQHIETLLHGGKSEARKAKDALKKEIARALQPSWKTKEQAKRDRNIFSKEMLSIYGKLFDSYGSIKNHNKTLVLGFLSHALFYFEDSHTYFEMFLVHVREALKDTLDGNLRHVAVTTASNTFAISTMWWSRTLCIGVSSKHEKISQQYQEILLQHLTEIFDTLETIIEKDEDNFPDAVETMKPSVVKSHLLVGRRECPMPSGWG